MMGSKCAAKSMLELGSLRIVLLRNADSWDLVATADPYDLEETPQLILPFPDSLTGEEWADEWEFKLGTYLGIKLGAFFANRQQADHLNNITPEARKERARKAAEARWRKKL